VLFGRIGARAKMQFPVHPHMLRHGCGYALANAGHDTRALQAWLGHKNIQHTRPKRFSLRARRIFPRVMSVESWPRRTWGRTSYSDRFKRVARGANSG